MNQTDHIYQFGPFHLDVPRRLLLRNGDVVSLTPKSFDTLVALVETRGKLIGKDELMRRVWPDSFVEEGNLTYNISILRKTLGERAGEHQYIATIPGQGYQFVADVSERLNSVEPESGPAPAPVSEEASKRLPRESFSDSVSRDKNRVFIVTAAVVAAVSIGFGLYRFLGEHKSAAGLAEPFQKMKIARLTTTGKATVAAISPDGKYVAHAMGSVSQQGLWLRHIATGSDKEIVPTAQVNYTALTFSPDGNYIYFLRVESIEGWNPLYRVPVLGGTIQKLGNDIDAGLTFSPDGQQIAYIRGNPDRDEALLITANADGTGEQTLLTKRPQRDVFPPPKAWTAWGPAWSPDGGIIAFALRSDEPDGKYWSVTTVRVEDHAEQQVTFQKWSSLGQITWLSDGSGLIVAAADQGSFPAHQLWHVAYPGGEVRRITNDTSGYVGASLTADSKALVTVRTEQSSNIWMVRSGDPTRAVQITSSNVDGFNGVSCTIDGRVVYTTRSRGFSDISIVNADGTSQQQLTVDAADNFSPSVSPDGRYIVFASTRTGKSCLWRTDIDGSNPKQLTYDLDARSPDISPDGKWVVYWDVGSHTRTLWKIAIEGGAPVQLTDYFSRHPSISPDGKQIVFFFLDERATPKTLRIAVISFEGGMPAKDFDFPFPPGQAVRWTSDGRALTYLDARNGVYNIWAQPIDGGAPRQLTNFTTDQIFAYAWSRDGKQLACARGNEKSDVVLISSVR